MQIQNTFASRIHDWSNIIGLDEAGRGALAGPLVAAAVRLTIPLRSIAVRSKTPIKDGKLLSPQQRERIFKSMAELNIEYHIATISARQINYHGIGWANREIFRRLIKNFESPLYIVDGKIKIGRITGKTDKIYSIVDADATIGPVMLAGIAAKVERDHIMKQYHAQYPEYKWNTNSGYGTHDHIEILNSLGPCRYHRTVFTHTALLNHSIKHHLTSRRV